MVLLAAICGVCFAYWHFTNGPRVKHEAEKYLEACSGWGVKIDRASFSVFGGIELSGVRIWASPHRAGPPTCIVGRVRMAHRPWDLAAGDLRPTDIACEEVLYTRDLSQMPFSLPKALPPPDPLDGPQRNIPSLPPIHLRGILRTADKGRTISETPLSLSVRPLEGNVYRVVFEQASGRTQGAGMAGSVKLNLATGEVSDPVGSVLLLEDVAQSLPEPYRGWLAQFHLRGASASFRQVAPAAPGQMARHEVEMVDLALTLPESQGGLELTGVTGTIQFDGAGVSFKDITGRVTQAGAAEFHASGRYGGYEPDSPFELSVRMQGASVPKAEGFQGEMAKVLRGVEDSYQPQGACDLAVQVERKAKGQDLRISGTVEPKGMKCVYHGFPYAVEDVGGKIVFDESKVRFEGVTARHGKSKLELGGWLELSGRTYDVRSHSPALTLDEEVHQALPKAYRGFWDMVLPRGQFEASVRMFRGEGDEHERADIVITCDGGTSMKYSGFPYRVDQVRGKARIEDAGLTLDLQGRHGDATCSIQGTIADLDRPNQRTDLDITGRAVTQDAELLEALGPQTRKLLSDLKVSGTAQHVAGHLHQADGKDMEYSFQASLVDASLTPPSLACEITQARGDLVIEPGLLTIKGLTGRHGAATVQLSGKLLPCAAEMGLDLHVVARGLELTDRLRDLLPEAGRQMWRQVQPVGKVDVDCTFRRNTPGQPAGEADYEVAVTADDLEACYVDFPYPMSHVSGKATISPGKIVFDGIRGRQGAMALDLSGTVRDFGREHQADLAVRVTNVPIDDKLFASLPAAAKPITTVLGRAGQCDIDFKRLRLVSAPAADRGVGVSPAESEGNDKIAGKMPAPRVGVSPASSPAAAAMRCGFEGEIALRGAVLDFGFGPQTVTGRVSGSAAFAEAGLSVEAQAAIDSLESGGRKATDLVAKISKAAGRDMLHIEDVSGKAMGGRLAGSAEIRLTQPVECGIQMEVTEVRLAELIPAAATEPATTEPATGAGPKTKTSFEGLLAGNLRLKARIGDVSSRQAVGELWISRAKINQIPVMLGMEKVVLVATPGEGAYTEGILRYELKGQNLLFNEIYLTSQGMSMVGSGKLDMKTEALRMSFLTRPGASIARMDSLSDLVAREISEIRVMGSLTRPLYRNVPLGRLDTAIRRLNNPSKDD